MTASHVEILPEATLRAFREAAAAAKPGEARTWLPETTPWRHALRVFGRRLRFAGGRAWGLGQRRRQPQAPEQFRGGEVAVPVAVHGERDEPAPGTAASSQGEAPSMR